MTRFVLSHLKKDFRFLNIGEEIRNLFAASIKYSIILKTILFDCFKMMLYFYYSTIILSIITGGSVMKRTDIVMTEELKSFLAFDLGHMKEDAFSQ